MAAASGLILTIGQVTLGSNSVGPMQVRGCFWPPKFASETV